MSSVRFHLPKFLTPSGMPDLRRAGAVIRLLLLVLFSACTTEPVETDLLLPVDFSNVPSDMVLTSYSTDKIEIRIQASPRHIEMINKENIRYPADLYTDLEFDPAGASDSIRPGDYLLPVDKNRIPVHQAVRIVNINPSYLSVRLEKNLIKTFKVTVPYTGTAAKGHIALEAACDPSGVTLEGPISLISAIDTLKTKPIDLNNAQETFKKKLPLDLEDHKLYSASQDIIVVTVPIQEKLVTRLFKDIPIRIWNAGAKAKVHIEPKTIQITIKGPFEAMGNKKITDQVFAFVDLAGMKPGIYARHVHVNVPAGLIMTEADPKVFTVKIH